MVAVAKGSSGHSVPLLNATAVATATSAPDTIPPIVTGNMDLCAQGFFFPQLVSTPQFVFILSNTLSCHTVGLSHF